MSKVKINSLGTRMKEYEMVNKSYLMRRNPIIIRLDGRAFHTFTSWLDKPFDINFVNIMQKTMLALCEEIQGCVLGYTQSDEITLVLVDYQNKNTCAWFDNQVQKIVSISSSLATLYFNKYLSEMLRELEEEIRLLENSTRLETDIRFANKYRDRVKLHDIWENKEYKAIFDSRVFSIPQHEVINNLIWRQQDATRNSINALAQSLYSHKHLNGINSKELQNKMLVEKDVNWNNLEVRLKRGSCAIKDEKGKWFIDNNIPIFTDDRNYIDKLVFINEN